MRPKPVLARWFTEPKSKPSTTHNSTQLRFTPFQPSIGGLVLRGIQALAEVSALVHQGRKELRGRLLQVSNVAEGQLIGVVVQSDHCFACASHADAHDKGLDPCTDFFSFHKCCCCSPCLASRRLASRRHAAKPSHLHRTLRICRSGVPLQRCRSSRCHRRARRPNTWKRSCSPFSRTKLAKCSLRHLLAK